MKTKILKVFKRLSLTLAVMLTVSSCSSLKLQWSDETTEYGLDKYVPHFLSEIKFFHETENGELTAVEDVFMTEAASSPICFDTGENSRFEMRHYGVNQGMGISYSIVYYFDGKEKKIIDTSGDNVFSKFALCDGERLCYLVSDGTLRVLERDGGRTDYENAFDCEKINLYFSLEEIKLYPDGGSIVIEQNDISGSHNNIIINEETPVIRSTVEISKPSNAPDSKNTISRWSTEICPIFDVSGINDVPDFIDRYKKTKEYVKSHTYNGELYYQGVNTAADGGYTVLDDVQCFSTGENEGYAVKSYRYKCDENPLFIEIYRFENGKLKLLDFSGDSSFNKKIFCDGERLCYLIDREFFRVLEKDGSRIDIPITDDYWAAFDEAK